MHTGAEGFRCSFSPLPEAEGEIEYCVDDQGRLRYIERATAAGSVTASYHDPGVVVQVTEPPAGQVTDVEIDSDDTLLHTPKVIEPSD